MTARLFLARRALALALALLGASAAAEPLPSSVVDLWPRAALLADPGHALDAAQALARREDFVVPTAPHANLGLRGDTVWLWVPLAGVAQGRWVLAIDYASLDEIDVHTIVGGRLAAQQRLGDHVPFGQRALASHSHAMPLAIGDTSQALLLRVRTTSTMIVPLRLVAEPRFLAEQSRLQMVQGVLAGLGVCLAIYALVHALALRSAMFAYYAVAVASTTLFFFAFFGLAPQHLWPEQEWLSRNAAPLLVLLAIFGSVRFVGEALAVHELSRALRVAQTVVWATALAAALGFAAGAIGYPLAQAAGTVLGVLCMVTTLAVALVRALRGDRVAWIVTAGWGVYAAGAFTMALLLRGKLPFSGWTEFAFQAGSVAEMLTWMLVLSMRMDAVRRDVHRSQNERDAMRSLAETDALTGLPNRRGLRQRLEASVPAAQTQRLGAIYMVDLDGFKAVNDRLGHDAGDLLLRAVAARLLRLLRAGDTVARLGGDEFVVCADAMPGIAEAQRLGEKLVEAFRAPFEIEGQRCEVGLTVGYALAPLDGGDPDALLKLADAALYAGKAAGKGRVLGAHQMRADSEGFRPRGVAPAEGVSGTLSA